ncbi:hypothetical protein [Homoserinibacter sp. YIM 151385]|uniref:hypothetical protein n=1 Tax=Homoserinibacter sp. YIM 151385 TaxID=2985506 RepID=UPI0022F13EBA|nr:hypothetical protein [Homoserinibacter sp. YIM 151385]WBU37639.1 hypothetical protein OF852_12065 [Homoserinibacter sp. YIM 151385]
MRRTPQGENREPRRTGRGKLAAAAILAIVGLAWMSGLVRSSEDRLVPLLGLLYLAVATTLAIWGLLERRRPR